MQDTKNLKRKQKECKKIIRGLEISQDESEEGKNYLDWCRNTLKWTIERINSRNKNRLKNEKQFRKAN